MQIPETIVVTPELVAGLKWVTGLAMTGTFVTLGFLFRLVFKFGQVATELKHVADTMLPIKANADKVPALETRIEQCENAFDRARSDHKQLAATVEKVRERIPSAPMLPNIFHPEKD